MLRIIGIHKNKAQTTNEYAILLAIVVAALIAMQLYVKRGIQGRVHELGLQISEKQYEQGLTESDYTIVQNGATRQEYQQGLTAVYQNGTRGSRPEITNRYGYEVINYDAVHSN